MESIRSSGYLVGIQQDGENGVGPVAAVGEKAQVRERLLRTASLPLELGQLVAELDQELGSEKLKSGKPNISGLQYFLLALPKPFLW